MWFKVVLFGGRLCSQSPRLHQISLLYRHPRHPSVSRQWPILAMDGPAGLASAYYTNDTLAFLWQQGPGCPATSANEKRKCKTLDLPNGSKNKISIQLFLGLGSTEYIGTLLLGIRL